MRAILIRVVRAMGTLSLLGISVLAGTTPGHAQAPPSVVQQVKVLKSEVATLQAQVAALQAQAGKLTLPFSGSTITTSGTPALGITNTGGQNNVNGGNAIEGHSTGQYFGGDVPPIGVLGTSHAGDGVTGISTSGGAGVSGFSNNGTGGLFFGHNGVSGSTIDDNALGVIGFARGSNSQAGSFDGNVEIFGDTQIKANPDTNPATNGDLSVAGTLTKGAGAFRIDHPLDPKNKYLFHSFVESPDMKNVYDGVVVLDMEGGAVVTLPAWFEALNEDYRYQLTAIGASASGLYVAAEIADNQFRIAGGRPGGRVSWQVTGIRHDAFANAHRIVVEQDKSASERGKVSYPEAVK